MKLLWLSAATLLVFLAMGQFVSPSMETAVLAQTQGPPTLTGTLTSTATPAVTHIPTGTPAATHTPTSTPTHTPTPTPTADKKVRVWLVDFLGRPKDASGGFKVVRDREGQAPQSIDQFEEACPTKKDFVEWKDCDPAWPDGKPEKNWPVAFLRDVPVEIKQARFKVKSDKPLKNVTVKGTADLGRAGTLVWQQAAVNEAGGELVINDVTSVGKLPNSVAVFDQMIIKWEVKDGAETLDAGASGHVVYVLLKEPRREVYVTLADNTTHAADGKSTEADVFNGIWSQFQSLVVRRRDLDPVSGKITDGTQLSYYDPAHKGFATCSHTSTAALLKFAIGQCGAWANYMQHSLWIHGIASKFKVLRHQDLDPASSYFLVKNWKLAGCMPASLDATWPFKFTATELAACDELGVAGQHNADPTSWFDNHQVVEYGGRIYDPSYGLSFDNVAGWKTGSVAAFCKGDFPPDGGGAFTAKCRS